MTDFNNKIENCLKNTPLSTPESLIENNDILYNCTECSSLIEILSIDEDKNIIEFKCLNKECQNIRKSMSIKEYLEKMEKNKKTKINEDICREHISCKNNKYVSYCFDCNCHLCEECLKKRNHINHRKSYIIEIKPIKEELSIIEEVIKHYKHNIENLMNEKINKKKELENSLEVEKINEDNKINNKIKINEQSKTKELKLNHDKYISDIEEIKEKFEKEIKDRENKYKIDEDKINNKYKIMNEKEYSIHKLKIDELCKKYKDIFDNLKYDEKIENMINAKKINEVVYNTYNLFNNNYYNSININNILLSYFKNDYIKNKIMKRILNNRYEEIIKLIFKKGDEDKKIKIRKEKEKEKIDLKINEIKGEYEIIIKELNKEKERLKEIIKENLAKNEEYKKINEEKMKNKEEQYRKELEEIKEKISYKYLIFISIFYNLL